MPKTYDAGNGHAPTVCPRAKVPIYVGKGYKDKFVCPACARTTWQALNFLGRRSVICDGVTFIKVAQP